MKKKEGFDGQEAIALPNKVLEQCEKHPYVNNLYTTWIGYYPKAAFHYRERKAGTEENILIYCTEGSGEAVIDSKKFKICPFEYLIVPAGKMHLYFADADSPWTIYWLHLKGAGANFITEVLYRKMVIGNNKMYSKDEMIGIFKSIYASLQLGYSLENMFFTSINLNHLLKLFLFSDSQETGLNPNKEENFDKVIRFLKDNIERSVSLKEIAAVANLSTAHFCSSFTKITGLSPIEYFNHLKIQKACQLLQFSRHRVNEIAQLVGISDPYYFSRLFTRTMGLSPKEYRQKIDFDNPLIQNPLI
ncbi:AraC family transcriptional regulator [Inquilinus sp. KBS0705]|nr:AraC family transcriptional regulator [Inquilinus sp. KBS0705]